MIFSTLAVLLGTALAAPAAPAATFGYTEEGPKEDKTVTQNTKRVNSYELTEEGEVTKLSIYAIHGAHWESTKKVKLKAIIYNDKSGSPEELLATGSEVVWEGSTGWLNLPFPSAVKLKSGTYWIGFISGGDNEAMGFKWKEVLNSRRKNTNEYSKGPSNPFSNSGEVKTDNEEMSLYATYEPTHLATGRVRYRVDLSSKWSGEATSEWFTWGAEHFAALKVYPGANEAKLWKEHAGSKPVMGYQDLNTESELCAGKVGIKEGKWCLDEESKRTKYKERQEKQHTEGYAGAWADDINFGERSYSTGTNKEYREVLDKTREVVSDSAAVEINAHWYDINPFITTPEEQVTKSLEDSGVVLSEHGIGYCAINGICGAKGFKEFLEYINHLHEKGNQIDLNGDGSRKAAISQAEDEYSLALYFLVNAPATNLGNGRGTRVALGGDWFGTNGTDPGEATTVAKYTEGDNIPKEKHWWSGVEVNLGEPVNGAEGEPGIKAQVENGVYRRHFEKGFIEVLPPAETNKEITLPNPPAGTKWHTLPGYEGGEKEFKGEETLTIKGNREILNEEGKEPTPTGTGIILVAR